MSRSSTRLLGLDHTIFAIFLPYLEIFVPATNSEIEKVAHTLNLLKMNF